MPTIITRGLGYDEPTILRNVVATNIVGDIVVEDRIFGVVVLEKSPVAEIVMAPIFVVGIIEPSTRLVGTVTSAQEIYAVVSEKGLPMASETNKVVMFIQDDRTLSLTVHQENGGPTNITDAKMWFTIKNRTTDPDSAALIQKKNTAAGGDDSQIHFTDPVNGCAEIYIVPEDTEDTNPGIYVFDVQVTLANGKTYTIARDKITFKEDVTKTRT